MHFQDNDDTGIKTDCFTRTDANRHFKQDYINLELEHEVVLSDDVIFQIENDDTLVIGYLTPDPVPSEFDFSENESLVEFRDQQSRDTHFHQMQDEGRHPLLVDRYSHSAVHFSIVGTANYPDRQFDVACCAVYTPSDYVLEKLEAGEIGEKELIKLANESLDIYSDYRNGAIYGVVVEKYNYSESDEIWTSTNETDSCWGYIGHKSALEALKTEFMNYQEIPAPATPTRRVSSTPSGPSL